MSKEDEDGIGWKQKALLVMLGIAIVTTPALVFGALEYTWEADPGITFEQTDGPSVEVGSGVETHTDNPFPDSHTVDLSPEGTFYSNGSTYVRVDQWGGDDSWTELSEIDANQNALEVDLEHRERVEIAGAATDVYYHDLGADAGHVLTVEHASGGTTEMTLGGFDDADRIAVVDTSDGSVLERPSVDDSGEITFTADGNRDYRFESTLDVSIEDPEPTGPQTDAPSELSVKISSPYDDEAIDVEFEHNGVVVGSDTVTGEGTATVLTDQTVMGTNDWTVTATDSIDNTYSESYEFQVPHELHIYNESDPGTYVDGAAEVTFFGDDDDDVYSRETSDGVVSLDGLPAQEFTIQVESDGYITRQTIIRSIFDQQAVYALPEDADTVNSRFELNDPTGQFEIGNTRVLIKKPITTDGTTRYDTVVADKMGSGGFSTLLERDQRYLIEVENVNTGEIRQLGPYVASASENVVLKVDQVGFAFEDEEIGYAWNATYVNETAPAVDFAFEANNRIQHLEVTITERGGNQTVILEESWSDLESVQQRAVIPDEVDNPSTATFSVEWTATVIDDNGNEVEVSGTRVVGEDRQPVDPDGVPQFVLSIVGVLLVFLVAGLFSAANVGVGGVVTSLFAGLLWFVGLLPGTVSGMMIALALLLSVMWMVRTARGPQ